jgi:hypothetical protein
MVGVSTYPDRELRKQALSPSSTKRIWIRHPCGRSSKTCSGSKEEDQVVDVRPGGSGLK